MSSELSIKLYHERQRRQLCLLHTINNLLGREEFKQADLDEICENLDERKWFNEHRSWLGLGNYDANILVSALQLKELDVVWFDSRLPAKRINPEIVVAYVFNIPSKHYLPFLNGRHWFAVLRRNNEFYNMDSKLHEPEKIDDFIVFANKLIADNNQLLLVIKPEHRDNYLLSED